MKFDFYSKFSLRQQIIIPFISVTLCLLILGSYCVGNFLAISLENRQNKSVEEVSYLILREFEKEANILQLNARLIADTPEIRQAVVDEDKTTLLKNLLSIKSTLELDFIRVVDKDGTSLVDLRTQELVSAKLANEQVLRQVLSGVYLSSILSSDKRSQSVLTGIAPLKPKTGVVGGVIIGTTISDELLEQIRNRKNEQILVFSQGKIIASTLDSKHIENWQVPKANTSLREIKLSSGKYLAKSLSLPGLNNSSFDLVLLESLRPLEIALQKLWIAIIIFTLFGAVVVVFIGSLIAKIITKRVENLTLATKKLAVGDFTTRINLIGNDEISTLAQSFNLMTEQLTERDRKIHHQVERLEKTLTELEITKNKLVGKEREYSKKLEIKVQERTEELQDKNEQLKETLQQLKSAQTQMIAQEKLASLGSLTAGIAHEINTPIGIGVTAASVLEEKTNNLLQSFKSGNMKRSEFKKYLDSASQSSQMILGNLNRAAELIQSFKQVAVDQSSEERRVFKIKKYLQEILLQLQPKLNNTKHQINLQGSDALSIDSYPGIFSQVLTNLIMNSLIHAYDESDSGNIVIKYYQEDTDFILEYQDDGKGIAEENITKIFEPFFTTKRNQGGTGLGLHIIYNIVTQKLLGSIQCESSLGVGSKFIIKIPITV